MKKELPAVAGPKSAVVIALVLTLGAFGAGEILTIASGHVTQQPSTAVQSNSSTVDTNSASSTSSWSNTTVYVRPDFANVTHREYKDPGTNMTLVAWVTDPVSVSGTVTTPDNVTLPMSVRFDANGTVYLSITLGAGFPSGYYVELITVVMGANTSLTGNSETWTPSTQPTTYPATHFAP